MTCTFFGHRDCPSSIMNELKSTIVELIEREGVNRFLVGDRGNFDGYVVHVLHDIKRDYPHIDYCVVLAYLPKTDAHHPTLYPQGIECVPKRFAISFRNEWMINNSDFVIGYIDRSFGGAHSFFEKAKRKGKTCMNLYK